MPRTRLDTRVQLLPDGMQPLKPGVTVHLHLGAARVEARLMPLTGALLPGAQGLVRLMPDHPIGAWRSDRFILRDASASHTLGGGVVLDPDPPVRGGRGEGRLAALTALAEPQPAVALVGLLEVSAAAVDLDRFARDGGLTSAELRTACGAVRRGP